MHTHACTRGVVGAVYTVAVVCSEPQLSGGLPSQVIGIDDLVDFEFMSRPKEMSLVKALELLYLRSPFAFISILISAVSVPLFG